MSEELRALTSNTVTGTSPGTNVDQALAYIGSSIWDRTLLKHWVLDLSDEPKPPSTVAFPFLDMVHSGGTSEGTAPNVFSWQDMGWPSPQTTLVNKQQQQFFQKASSEFWEDAKNSSTFDGLAKGIVQAAQNSLAANVAFNVSNDIRNSIVLAAQTHGRTVAVDPIKPTAAEIESMFGNTLFRRSPAEHCFFLHSDSEEHFFGLPGFEANTDIESLSKGVVGFYRGYRVVSCLGPKGFGSDWSVLFGSLADVSAVWFNKFTEMRVNDQQFAASDEVVLCMKWVSVVYTCRNVNQYNSGQFFNNPRILYFKTS